MMTHWGEWSPRRLTKRGTSAALTESERRGELREGPGVGRGGPKKNLVLLSSGLPQCSSTSLYPTPPLLPSSHFFVVDFVRERLSPEVLSPTPVSEKTGSFPVLPGTQGH